MLMSVSIAPPSDSKQSALFHCRAYDYPRTDWDGLHDHLKDIPWQDIFKHYASAATASEFCEFRLGLMYIFLIVSIRSNLSHLHGL